MSTPAVDEVLEELRKNSAALEFQIQGLIYVIDINSSHPELVEILTEELEDRVRRKKLVDESIAALDALNDDGYPEMKQTEITPGLHALMQLQSAQIEAAIDQFVPVEPEAAAVSIELGEPTDNP